jgi:CheY-like chemotaxis protein
MGEGEGRGNGMKILYVEDNDDNIFMLKRRLTRAGYTVVVATDGAQGVAMAASERPDLVLMDLSLPVLDGWEATRRIKAASETRSIPVIALTAHAMSGDEEKARAACGPASAPLSNANGCTTRSPPGTALSRRV